MRTFKDNEGVEYLHSQQLGYAVKSRVQEAVNKGWLVPDKKMKDYAFTERAIEYKNFWLWLQGDSDKLFFRDNGKNILD